MQDRVPSGGRNPTNLEPGPSPNPPTRYRKPALARSIRLIFHSQAVASHPRPQATLTYGCCRRSEGLTDCIHLPGVSPLPVESGCGSTRPHAKRRPVKDARNRTGPRTRSVRRVRLYTVMLAGQALHALTRIPYMAVQNLPRRGHYVIRDTTALTMDPAFRGTGRNGHRNRQREAGDDRGRG